MTPVPFRLGGWPCVVADPPWKFDDTDTRLAPGYDKMDVESIERLPVTGSDDAFLFLWVPNAFVLDGTGTRVARAWGFEPRQLIPWVKTSANGKPRLGGGHYTRVVTEQLVLCRRGSAKVLRHDVPGVIIAPRGRHSAKPDESYQLVEKLTDGPYLELFARRRYSPAWTVWGKEAPREAA